MADNTVQVEFGARFDELMTALNSISTKFDDVMRQVNTSAKTASSAMDGLASAFKRYASIAAVVYEARQSIAMFEGQVLAAQRFAAQLGISTTEADILTHALNDVDATTQQYSRAMMMLNRNLVNNADGMKRFGIETKNADGSQKSQTEIMQKAIDVVNSYAAGNARNSVSLQIFGMRAGNLTNLLKLNTEEMKRAEAVQRELGTGMTTQSVGAAVAYHKAMKNVGDVMESMRRVLAMALMPALTAMASWFRGSGAEGVKGFTAVVNSLTIALESLAFGFRLVVNVLVMLVQDVAELVGGLVKALEHPLSADSWKNAFKTAWQAIEDNAKTTLDKIAKDTDETANRIKKLLPGATGAGNPAGTPTPPPTGGIGSAPPTDKDLMAQWEKELAMKRNFYEEFTREDGRYHSLTVAEELAFWQEKLANTTYGSNLWLQINNKVLQAAQKQRQEYFAAQMAQLQQESQEARNSAQERLDIAQREAELVKSRRDSTAASIVAAETKVKAAEYALRQESIAASKAETEAVLADKLAQIQIEQNNAETMVSLYQMTEREKIEALKRFEEQRFAAQQIAIYEEMSQLDQESEAYKEYVRKLEEIQRQHLVRMGQMNNEGRKADLNSFEKWLSPMTDAFDKFVDGLIMGTQKWSDMWRNILKGVLASYVKLMLQLVIEHILGEKQKTAATAEGTTERLAIESFAAIKSGAIWMWDAIKSITASAWKGAAAVFANVASIPYVGWILAPAMAVAAAATVLGFIGKIGAAGGFDVPSGSNPMTQLHEREMVLPADIAEPLRASIRGGGGAAVGGTNINFYSSVLDRDAVRRFLRGEGRNLVDAVSARARNFGVKVR